jgi:hypothetical protein
LLCNFALEYTIRNVQENQEAVKLNATHRVMVYADDKFLAEKEILQRRTQKLHYTLIRRIVLKLNAKKMQDKGII